MTTPVQQKMTIRVTASAIDGWRKTRSFKTLAGARRFAVERVGETPEMGSDYAIAGDGVCKVTVMGCTLAELFAASAKPAQADYTIAADTNADAELYVVRYGVTELAAYDTYHEAAEHVAMAREYDANVLAGGFEP